MRWLLARLKEPSTWRGIVMLAMAFGVALEPEQAEAVVAAGAAVAGLIGVLTADRPGPLPPVDRPSEPARPAEQPARTEHGYPFDDHPNM